MRQGLGWLSGRFYKSQAAAPSSSLSSRVFPRLCPNAMQLALGWDEDSQLLAASDSSSNAASSSSSGSESGSISGSGGGSSVDRIGWGGPFWLHALAQVAATALGLPIAVGLVVLLVWNAYLFVRNTTTIEHHEGERPLWMRMFGGCQCRCMLS